MEKQILDKLIEIKKQYEEANLDLQDNNILSNIKKVTSLNKFIKKNYPKVILFDKWTTLNNDISDAEQILKEETELMMVEELKKTITSSKKQIEEIEIKLKEIMVEKDPLNDNDVIIEIQGAAGGDEAKIFAGDLYRMYLKYATKTGFNVDILDEEQSENGGYSSITLKVEGLGAYGLFKFESGVHRVQRVPLTETQGRVHTSTATVSVFPDVDEEFNIEIKSSDLKIDTYRSGGSGGQHANKTDSAVRITHLPSGIVTQSQDGRSQHDNKDKSMQQLKAKLYQRHLEEEQKALSANKKNQVGSGDRSEKIRTYNFPQNRITDHRIGLTLKKLDRVMDGGLEEIINVLNSTSENGELNE